jgi:hypothetical protein
LKRDSERPAINRLPPRGKLDHHREFLLGLIEQTPSLTISVAVPLPN